MPAITIQNTGTQFTAQPGVTLLAALLGAKLSIAHKCEGKAQCGSCHIYVHDGAKSLSKIQRVENDKLDAIVGVGSQSRLACQAVLGDADIVVELLGVKPGI
ncbi:MAG: hypothetical protein AMXMBFR6_26180 [Betaproteobacteria bacterium]|nr:2Fe-2S ferredoxin [Rhodocyclaceae bacterium]